MEIVRTSKQDRIVFSVVCVCIEVFLSKFGDCLINYIQSILIRYELKIGFLPYPVLMRVVEIYKSMLSMSNTL